jgi:DNA-binding transcriptional MerR regulator
MSSGMEKTYSIKTTARLVDMNTHTIRAWERRYKALDPNRNSTNNRRQYSEHDVTRLGLLARLVKSGHQISHIAPLPNDLLEAMICNEDESTPASPTHQKDIFEKQVLQRCLAALEQFDLILIHAELESSRHVLSAHQFLLNLAVPLLRTVGDRVSLSTLSIAQEHALSSILRAQLMQIFFNLRNSIAVRAYSRKDQKRGKIFCLATREGDLHEFGILASAILVAHYGHIPYYFGPNLPAEALANAAEAVNADVILLGNTPGADPFGNRKQSGYLTDLTRIPGLQSKIWWGGELLIEDQTLLAKATHIPTLSALEDALSAQC